MRIDAALGLCGQRFVRWSVCASEPVFERFASSQSQLVPVSEVERGVPAGFAVVRSQATAPGRRGPPRKRILLIQPVTLRLGLVDLRVFLAFRNVGCDIGFRTITLQHTEETLRTHVPQESTC
jgi:hypothetical protein